MKRCLIAGALFLFFLFPLASSGVERFPRPEFESGYRLPVPSNPGPRSNYLEYLDVLVLTGALILAGYFVLKTRSRRSIFLLSLFSLIYFGFWRLGCVCSIGAIQNVSVAFFEPDHVIPLTVVAFFILPLVFALLFGRVFCAGVCPLGALQDMVILRPLRVPRRLSEALSVIPYLYLGLAALFAVTGSFFLICRQDPFIAIFRRSGHAHQFVLGFIVLGAGVFIARPYCRYLCPYAVLLRWCSRLSKWHASITPDECIKCRLCEDSCPFDAISKPTEDRQHESRSTGLKRLAFLILLVPFLAAAGGVAGYGLHDLFSRTHRDVRLMRQMALEKEGKAEPVLESQTFRASTDTEVELFDRAERVRNKMATGSVALGIFMGLVFGCKLIRNSIHRKKEDYEPDRAECLSCGRCFICCPREQLRHKTQDER